MHTHTAQRQCTDLRPIGIGEALRRLICRLIAVQDRKLWDYFCTHLLPEDEASRELAIREAKGIRRNPQDFVGEDAPYERCA